MIRNATFALAAALMTLTAFSGTLSILEVGTVKPAVQAGIA